MDVVIGPLTRSFFGERYAEVRESFLRTYVDRFILEDNGPAYGVDVVASYLEEPRPATFDGPDASEDIVLVAVRGVAVLAFASCHFFRRSRMAMVSSLARARRGGAGLVPRLEGALLAELRRRECAVLVFEVQDPFDAAGPPRERARRRQRALLFARSAERLGVSAWVQRGYAPPKLDTDQPEPGPMLLVWAPLAGADRSPAELRDEVLRFVMIDCYGFGLAPDDPYLQYLEQHLDGQVREKDLPAPMPFGRLLDPRPR